MDQTNQNQPQQVNGQQGGAPSMQQNHNVQGPVGAGMPSVGGLHMMQNQVLPQHLMQLMANPALAAAAAANPIFPPAAIMSNPSAFLPLAANGPMPGQQTTLAGQQGSGAGPPGNMVLQGLSMGVGGNYMGGDQSMQQSLSMQQNVVMQQMNATNGMNPMGSVVAFGQNPNQVMPSNQAMSDDNGPSSRTKKGDLSAEEKLRVSRDRNREHARSTRLRKKAYVQKLKELVEGLHAERSEELRQRRVAIQHLAEKQNVRRAVIQNFLRFLAEYETDKRKWITILEDDFWLKQPVTPYRSFRRAEIERDSRFSRGVDAIVCEGASLSVMIEGIGIRSSRWMKIKREEFLRLEERHRGSRKMPLCVVRQDSRLKHAISSLSSSSGSSNHASSGEDTRNQMKHSGVKHGLQKAAKAGEGGDKNGENPGATKVSSSSGSSNDGRKEDNKSNPNDFHDYHAKPLPDPKLGDFDRSSDSSQSEEDSPDSSEGGRKRISTDSSSGDDYDTARTPLVTKRRKLDDPNMVPTGEAANTSSSDASRAPKNPLPPNIAKKGGISHNIRPSASSVGTGSDRFRMAPAIPLPPFAGIGKRAASGRSPVPTAGSGIALGTSSGRGSSEHGVGSAHAQGLVDDGIPRVNDATSQIGPAVIANDVETSSDGSSSKYPQIRGCFHINEDDMILMEDVLMCPFVFRSHDAVLCGALSECVMPGMLRANFSARNKLVSLEMVYDAMGFMQQLERASGNDGTAQIVPGSLEMALSPCSTEARVITTAKAPFSIVNVNDLWTKTTGYTQMEVEGKPYLALLEGEGTIAAAAERSGKPVHKLEEVANGRCACSTNIHYDKKGQDYIEFICSYPLTNSNDEVTHLLHVSKELPSFQESLGDQRHSIMSNANS